MPGKLTIATCQHAVSGDMAVNLAAVKKQLRYARSRGADIAHFPECNLSRDRLTKKSFYQLK